MSEKDQNTISWQVALKQNVLTPDQLAVLQKMVDDDQVETLEAAAQFLDWQERFMAANEHMYGF